MKTKTEIPSSLKTLWGLPPTWLRFLVIILLLFGIFFRFANLDRKVYWSDETVTSLRVSGYTEAELVQKLPDSRVFGVEEIYKYQRPNPDKGVIDTIKSLAVEDPQHPPLYYVMARFWAKVFGSSVAVMRSLPALISLLAFPCIYWLCLELFQSSVTGWVAVVLIAVSPFHLVYAQEAREYSLWTVTILLSSAALLRAIRLKTRGSWGIYAITLIASFYTFLFSVLVAIGHGIYIAAMEKWRLSKTLIAYLSASLLSFLAFIPWLFVVGTNRGQAESTTAWMINKSQSLTALISGWAYHITQGFFDINIDLNSSRVEQIVFKLYELIVLALGIYAFYFVCRKAPKRIWLFILTLSGVTGLALILPDLPRGGGLSTQVRFAVSCYLGIHLAIANLLATKLNSISTSYWQQKLWQMAIITLLSGGIFSCAVNSQAEVWWNKLRGEYVIEASHIINQAHSPLAIGSLPAFEALTLSHRLEPKVQLLVKPKCDNCHLSLNSQPKEKINIPAIPEGYSDAFLLRSGLFETWFQEIQAEKLYKLEPINSKANEIVLWRLKK